MALPCLSAHAAICDCFCLSRSPCALSSIHIARPTHGPPPRACLHVLANCHMSLPAEGDDAFGLPVPARGCVLMWLWRFGKRGCRPNWVLLVKPPLLVGRGLLAKRAFAGQTRFCWPNWITGQAGSHSCRRNRVCRPNGFVGQTGSCRPNRVCRPNGIARQSGSC